MVPPNKPTRMDRFAEREQAQDLVRKEQLREQKARQENTVRLKALRLAKEAADKAAAEAAPKPAPKKALRKGK